MTLSGFWAESVSGSPDNMNRTLLQFDTDANIQAIASFKLNTMWFATDTKKLYRDNGSAIVFTGLILDEAAQTLVGVKTFSSIPLGPASDPTTANQLARFGLFTVAATASKGMLRDANGRSKVSDPAVDADVANRGWVNGSISTHQASSDHPDEATQGQVEGETAGLLYIPPDLARHIPGAAKAYCTVASDGTLQANSYNISGVVKNSTGRYTVSFDTDFSNQNYTVVASPEDDANNGAAIRVGPPSVGSIDIEVLSAVSALVDNSFHLVAFGDQ